MTIMDYFPYPTPREGQRQVLTKIEENWDNADVFVVILPTAAGKTAISIAIMRWLQAEKKVKSSYSTPTNIQVQQFEEAFPKTFALHRKGHYKCMYPRPVAENCGVCHALHDKECPDSPYLRAVKRAHTVPWLISNTYTFLAHKLYRPVVIFDEAHNLPQVAKERLATIFWHKDYDFPSGVRNYGGLLDWINSKGDPDRLSPKLKLLKEQVDVVPPKYLVQKTYEMLRRNEELCLKLVPVDVSDRCGFLWPGILGKKSKSKNAVQKVVLLSATISQQDVADLGLDGKRVMYLEVDSPIAVERRPVNLLPIANMSYGSQDAELPTVVDYLLKRLETAEGKGFIHTTYGMSYKLRKVPELRNHPRLIWHDREDRTDQYERFKRSQGDEVLVACGMEEGVSLDYELARWQVITKCPYPSLAEPAIRYLAEQKPQWYKWETLKKLVQACGRVCRTPEDWGETDIIDTSALRLLKENDMLIPRYLKDALRWPQEKKKRRSFYKWRNIT